MLLEKDVERPVYISAILFEHSNLILLLKATMQVI